MATPKIKIEVQRRARYDQDSATVLVYADGKQIARGGVGGEPEDNSIDRDYDWITGAIAATAKACGADVEEAETTDPEDE